MKPYEETAVRFAQALVDGRWQDAHRSLEPELQKKLPAEALQTRFSRMFTRYAEGPARRVHFNPEFSMQTWPDKKIGDIGWVYVGIEGDDFVEAVTVVVSDTAAGLAIRELEWGRP